MHCIKIICIRILFWWVYQKKIQYLDTFDTVMYYISFKCSGFCSVVLFHEIVRLTQLIPESKSDFITLKVLQ